MVSMIEDREALGRRPRTPRELRRRRRWGIVAAAVAGWVVLEVLAGSATSATVLLVVLACLGAAAAAGLRALGITRDHPWIRPLASRPWRDGQDVLRIAMLHLSDVFVVTPSGSLLAPKVVELQLNPDDLSMLCERMELGVIRASLAEVYEEQAAAHGARFAGPGRAEVHVIESGSVPPGRYFLRQEDPVSAADRSDMPAWYSDAAPDSAYAVPQPAPAQPGGRSRPEPDSGSTVARSMVTTMEQRHPVPVLRLITGSSTAETAVSGARAGRGSVELVLPDVPTVSREHAIFTFSAGRWWVANQGRNGLTLNGTPVAGKQPLGDGDAIRWGTRQDALLSRVEIS
jgi:FHA domain